MRILLSVGCDTYLHVPKLTAAAKDARSVFSALVGTQEHQYDPDHSKLLISPNAEQFRKALSDILYDHSGIAVFTLFFAGHATVYDETLYLGLADTRPDRIPATAIGFSDVLRTTAGARPKQANFIIDACNAGGLGFDIGSILKRSIVGNSDTMGISFVASATAEQSAGETAEGGQFTVEFAKTLIGDIYIQQARPFLSLAEISQQIQESGALREQNISYWSLNLQGPNLFAKNLHFSGPSQATDRIVAQLQKQKVDTGKRAAGFKSAIAMITNGVNERSLASVLEPVFAGMEPYQRASMIYGLAEGLSMELSTADDPFLEHASTLYCSRNS
jgi:hypothetical protein